jgi:hypothetical protein
MGGWIGLDGVADAGPGKRGGEAITLLGRKRVVVARPGDIDRRGDRPGAMMRAIGIVGHGDVAAVERGGSGDPVAELGSSQSAVSRIWRAFGLAPHRQDS